MLRRIALFLALIGISALVWWWQPWKSSEPEPRFMDRLPVASVIGKTDVLQFAEQLQPLFYYYQMPSREFMSQEFFLRQAKAYGLDIQKPAYFFGELDSIQTGNQDWGLLIHVSDSSKIQQGIEDIDIFLDVKVESIEEQRIIIIPTIDLAFTYGTDWMLLSQPKTIQKYLKSVTSAKLGSMNSEWKEFLEKDSLVQSTFSSRVKSEKIAKFGFDQMNIQLKNDSSDLIIQTEVLAQDDFPFELGVIRNGLRKEEFTKNFGNLNFINLDQSELKNRPYYKLLEKLAARLSFPMEDFLNTWTGQLSFRQGGWHIITERYVESEYDENFNYVEVTKYKSSKVKGLSVFLSVNEELEPFKAQLISKGILTNQERKNYFLFSPPLNEKITDSSALYYTNKYMPQLKDSLPQGGMFTYEKVPYHITLDSLNGSKLYGEFRFPLKRWVK